CATDEFAPHNVLIRRNRDSRRNPRLAKYDRGDRLCAGSRCKPYRTQARQPHSPAWEKHRAIPRDRRVSKNRAAYRIHEDATSLQAVLEHTSRAAGISSMKMLRLNLLTGRLFQ